MPPVRPEPGRRFWPVLAGIVAAAVAIRVLYTLLEAPWPPSGLDDQFFFSASAHLLADGRGFVNPFAAVFKHMTVPTAEHPPLYTVVLAGLAKVGLGSSDAQRLSGSVFGAGTLVAVALIARRLAGPRAGLIAAGLGALYPVLVAADGALMSESLFGLLVALTLLAALRLLDRPSAGRALALGALAGLAALTRGEALLLLLLLLLPVLRGPGLRPALLAAVACLVVLAPWEIRTWSTFGRPVLIATNSGTAVGGANCGPTYHGAELGGWDPACLRDTSGNEAVNHAHQLSAGVRYARRHAGRVPVVLAARLGRVWDVYDPFDVPEGRSPRVQKLGVPVLFALLLLGAGGVVVLRRRRAPAGVLLAPFLTVGFVALTTYGNPRFRQPADVALVVLAGVALAALWERRRARA